MGEGERGTWTDGWFFFKAENGGKKGEWGLWWGFCEERACGMASGTEGLCFTCMEWRWQG